MMHDPFTGPHSKDKENYWGIVVVLEDAYIRRVLYYEKAKELLAQKNNIVDWEWMLSHIKVVSLYEIERICLGQGSLIEACQRSLEDPFNFSFSGYPQNETSLKISKYLNFRKSYDNKAMQIIAEMNRLGFLQ